MESCCRACSRSDDFRRFSLYAVAEVSQEVIANMIRDTSDTQVSTEDGLPQQICPDCLMTLSLAYSFRKQCRRSDAKFREYWGGRTPSQSVDQQQHQQQQQQQNQQHQLPRRSQSQIPEESSFEAVATTIKEEVDIYDYEYSVPAGHDNQWVIQNPRTIGEGAMTVVHNTGGHYYDEGAASETGAAPDRDGHSMLHPMDDATEMGESSGLGQKDDKLKKNVPNPERYSQRIRRQSDEIDGEGGAVGEFGAHNSKEVEILKTSRGKDLLALDGYVFYRNSQRGNRCYWECKGRSRKPEGQLPLPKCPARVTTDFFDNKHELLSYKGVHTHSPDLTLIQEIKQRNMLKEAAATDGAKPSDIIRQVYDVTALSPDQRRLSMNAQRKIIKRARNEEHASETIALDSIDVPFDLIRAIDGSQFYQAQVRADSHSAFIFATLDDIKNLMNSKFWIVASTFSAKTGLQRQVLVIHSSIGPSHQQMSPAIYVLAAASYEPLYRQVFCKLKEIVHSMEQKLNPQLVLTDFEKPLVNALEAEFPQTRQSMCFFHFSHHLFRSVEKHGLAMSFEKNYWLLQNYKRLKALAYLPAEHIPDAFYVLKSNAPLELHRFLDDFADNFIFGKVTVNTVDGTPMRSRPTFSPTFWSLHPNILLAIPGTYQHSKEWHYRMARILTAYHSDPLNVFRSFQHEQQEAQTKLAATLAGMGSSRRTEEDMRNETVRSVATNFTSYPTLQFLDTIVDNFGSEGR